MEFREFVRPGRLASLLCVPALFGVLACIAPAANAAVYCCNDPSGKKVCGSTMPAVCAGRETKVATEKGTKQIEAALTPEQRAEREAEAARRKKEDEAQKEQKRLDAALLNTYISVNDIDLARARAEKDVEAQIKSADDKIKAAAARRKKLDSEAEFYKNKPLPDDIKRKMKDAEFEITAQNELMEAKKKDLENIRAKFDADKKRYEELKAARTNPRGASAAAATTK